MSLFSSLIVLPASVAIALSLHDALPIYRIGQRAADLGHMVQRVLERHEVEGAVWKRQRLRRSQADVQAAPVCLDRKSTRLNSSHLVISYAVFCLKKKILILTTHHTKITV